MAPLLFARLQADVELKLRRGAWYRVLQLDDLQAVLDVNRRRVSVLRAWLEIQQRPPQRWSVVSRPPGGRRAELGTQYGVCPNCRARAPLPKRPRILECNRCQQEFEVNWGEVTGVTRP
ncbi:MAG: hypothetical protein WD773_10545 [Gemmatimonadales bacterium]